MALKHNKRFQIVAFLVADIIATGMGMGVPIFNILLGFVVGWCYPRLVSLEVTRRSQALRNILRVAFLTSSFTFLLMAILWLPTMSILFEPGRDIANFGIPMILFEPLASFIGWLVLMVLISPFLQVLTTVFSAIVSMACAGENGLSEVVEPAPET